MVYHVILVDILLIARIFPRPCGARKSTTQLAKYPRVLYVKPSNKMYLFTKYTEHPLFYTLNFLPFKMYSTANAKKSHFMGANICSNRNLLWTICSHRIIIIIIDQSQLRLSMNDLSRK